MNIVLMNFGFLGASTAAGGVARLAARRCFCCCRTTTAFSLAARLPSRLWFPVFGVTDYIDNISTLHYGACVAKEPRSEVSKVRLPGEASGQAHALTCQSLTCVFLFAHISPLGPAQDVCRRLGLRLAEWIAVYVDNKPELHPLKTTKNVDGRDVAHKEEPKKKKGAKNDKAASDSKPVASKAPANAAPAPEGKVHLIVRMSVPVRNQTAWTAMVSGEREGGRGGLAQRPCMAPAGRLAQPFSSFHCSSRRGS